MVPFTLGKKIGTAGSKYRSNDIEVVSAEALVRVSITSGTLIINGVDSASLSALVTPGTYVAIRLTAPESGKAIYSRMTIENRSSIFELVSSVLGQLVFDTENPVLPLDFYGYANHIEDNAWSPDPKLTLHKMSASLEWQASSDLTDPQNRSLQQDYLFVTNRWSNNVLRIDPTSLDLEQVIDIDRPVGIGRISSTTDNVEAYHFYVAQENGNVVRLSPDNEYEWPSETIKVGSKPSDILSNGRILWVVNSGSDSVSRIYVENDLTYSVQEIPLPPNSQPARILALGNYLYVSLFARNAVAKINVSSPSIELIEVGQRPFGITTNGNSIFVLCQQDKTIWNVTEGTEVALLENTVAPTFIQSAGAGFIVLDTAQEKAHHLNAAFETTRSFNTSKPIEALLYGPDVFLFSAASNAHDQRVPADFYPENFEFDPSFGHDLEETVVSGSYIVSGVNTPVYLSAPSENASLLVNGQPSEDTWVENGDTIQVETVTSSLYGSRSSVLISLGGESAQFITTTVEQKAIPDSVVFDPVDNATPLTEYTSNTVDITGIPAGLSIEASAIDGQLIHNGVEVTGTVLLETGDTVALRLTSGELDEWRNAVLRIGPISAVFAVASEKSPDSLCSGAVAPSFTTLTNVEIGTTVLSSVYNASNVNPEPVEISSSYNATLLIDGVDVGTNAVLSYGQELQLQMKVTGAYSLFHVVVLHSCGANYTWKVQTEPDRTPDFFSFTTIRNKEANEEVLSETVTLTGMDSTVTTDAEIFPECDVLVNGIRINTKTDYDPKAVFTFPVQLGDTIQLAGLAGSPFGTERRYTLTIGRMVTSYSLFSRPVDGAYESPNNMFLVKVDMVKASFNTSASIQNLDINTFEKKVGASTEAFEAVLPSVNTSRRSTFEARSADSRNQGTRANKQIALEPEARQPIVKEAEAYSFDRRDSVRFEFEGMEAIQEESVWRKVNMPTSEVRKIRLEEIDAPESTTVKTKRRTFDQPETIRNVLNRKFFDQPETIRNVLNRKFLDQPTFEQYAFSHVEKDMFGHQRTSSKHTERVDTFWQNPSHKISYDVYQYYKPRVVTDHLLSEEAEFRMRTVVDFHTFGMDYQEQKRQHLHYFEGMYALYNPFPFIEYEQLEALYNPVPFVEFGPHSVVESGNYQRFVFINQEYEQKNTAAQAYVFLDQEFDPVTSASQSAIFLDQDFQLRHSSSANSLYDLQAWKISKGTLTTFVGPDAVTLDIHYSTFSAEAEKLYLTPIYSEEQKPQLKPSPRFTMGPVGNIQRSFTVMDVVPPKGFDRNSNETFEDKDRSILTPELMKYAASHDEAYQWAVDKGVDESRIQTYELHPGCWVWAEVLDQPNWCEEIPDTTVEGGWVKGG